MNLLRIGLAQTPQVGDFKTNAEAVLRYVDLASEQGVQIVCFPESQTVVSKLPCSVTTKSFPFATSIEVGVPSTSPRHDTAALGSSLVGRLIAIT